MGFFKYDYEYKNATIQEAEAKFNLRRDWRDPEVCKFQDTFFEELDIGSKIEFVKGDDDYTLTHRGEEHDRTASIGEDSGDLMYVEEDGNGKVSDLIVHYWNNYDGEGDYQFSFIRIAVDGEGIVTDIKSETI